MPSGKEIPEGDNWTYELKLDGYRLQAVKAGGKVILYSRRGIDLTKRFEYVAKALASLPEETVIDGELVALDEEGKPNFDLLQNFRSAGSHVVFYAFDILIHKGHDLKQLPLSQRRAVLATAIEPSDHVGLSYVSDETTAQMVSFVSHILPRCLPACRLLINWPCATAAGKPKAIPLRKLRPLGWKRRHPRA
jgi:ATP-dependent DNA ligase